MIDFLISIVISTITIFIIVKTNKYHAKYTNDNQMDAIQRYHTTPTPRLGSIPILTAILGVTIIDYINNIGIDYQIQIIMSLLLIFTVGISEDIIKNIKPGIRMFCFIIGTLFSIIVFKSFYIISYTGFIGFNHLILNYPVIGFLLTIFCVIGLCNAYNIVDGFNGLSAFAALINLFGIAILSYIVGSTQVFHFSLLIIGAILGFLIFNYPYGKIFLGDGGAYSLGFLISILSINLIQNSHEFFSPFAFLLLAIYPVTEIAFSIYRRKFIHKTNGMEPDNRHLHQLVYAKCIFSHNSNSNAKVLPMMIILIIPQLFLAIIFHNDTYSCILCIFAYIAWYCYIYFKLLSARRVKFLKLIF
jgi:UDP-N-acetylmuramyl pentapeptide phosphotransferase/UDP-N-acetylglucosamine-1-phosphate transferase